MRIYNTGETDASLKAQYNPDNSTLRKAQLRMIDMLDYLNDVAKKAGVVWRLDGGNVLGALRHNGFIPWDDDVDIVVDRHNYKLLCDYLKRNPHPQYVLQDHTTDKGYYKYWASLRDLDTEHISTEPANSLDRKSFEQMQYRGLHIDIFPYEDRILPCLQRIAGKMAVKLNLNIATRMPSLGRVLFHVLDCGVFPLFRAIGYLFGKKGFYMHSYGAWFYERFPHSVVRPYRPITFEGKTYNGPAAPEAFCRIIYGNYMELPPKEKRNRHQVDIVFKE